MAIPLNPLIALAWLVGMLLSPEALAMQGNLVGIYGLAFLFPLASALMLHGMNIVEGSILHATTHQNEVFATFGASLRSLVALPAVAVSLATAALVTSGFVFNETFIYWFPNFGFAALLLAVLLVLNLAGPRIATIAQTLMTATALIGLTVLTLAGVFGDQPDVAAVSTVDVQLDIKGFALGAVALLGYDLIRYLAADLDRRRTQQYMLIAILFGGSLVWAWNSTVLAHVSTTRLADSSIPHILAAKAVMGPNGRILIGLVVIAGSLAAVNLLFRAVTLMLVGLVNNGAMPATVGVAPSRPWLPPVVLSGLTGLLMAAGFAGSDWLDITLRAGLILWLVSLGLDHLPPLLSGHGHNGRRASRMAAHLALLTSMTALGIVLVTTDESPGMLIRALLTLTTIAVVLAAVGLAAAGRRPINRRRKASQPKEGVLQ